MAELEKALRRLDEFPDEEVKYLDPEFAPILQAARKYQAIEPVITGLVKALEYYADPNTYFAISLFPDTPCGDLINDWSVLTKEEQEQWEDYRADKDGVGEYYGKTARQALAVVDIANKIKEIMK